MITTADILNGLDLIIPELDGFDLPKEIEQAVHATNGTDPAEHPLQAVKPHDPEDVNENQSPVSPYSTVSSPQLPNEQVATNSQLSTPEPATTTEEIDMKEQFLAYALGTKSVRRDKARKCRAEHEQRAFFYYTENVIEPHHVDVDAFVDMRSCAPPSIGSQSSYNEYLSLPSSMPPMIIPQLSHVQAHQLPPELIYDSYLPPWPSSLAAAHQSVAT